MKNTGMIFLESLFKIKKMILSILYIFDLFFHSFDTAKFG